MASEREISDEVAFGRQVITLMSVALVVAAGVLVDLDDIGFRFAWYAFQIGASWVALVGASDEAGPTSPGKAGVREPRSPAPLGPPSSVGTRRQPSLASPPAGAGKVQ